MLIDSIVLLKACEEEREETVHAICGCQWVKEIWWEDGFCGPHISDRFASFRVLFFYIWFKRNAVSLKQASLPYSQIYSDSLARRHEFHLAAEFMVQPAVISRPSHLFIKWTLMVPCSRIVPRQGLGLSLEIHKAWLLVLCPRKFLYLPQGRMLKLLLVGELLRLPLN